MSKIKKTTTIHWGESYTSLVLGVLVVVAIAILVILFAGRRPPSRQVTSTHTENLAKVGQITDKKSSDRQVYSVKPGDNLWNISEKRYKSGYKWVEIARANHLKNPGLIHVGNILTMPSLEKSPTEIQKPSISDKAYDIVEGDSLWDIAVRAYGDGYRWVELAKVNNIENPDLIYPDNVLKIPR